jgi:HEAT repeat protein
MDRIPDPNQLISPEVKTRLTAAEFAAQHPQQCRHWGVELAIAAGDSDDAVAMAAAEALEMLGAPPETLLPSLLRLAEQCCSKPVTLGASAEGETAYWTVTLIGRLGPTAAPATECLTKLLNHSIYLPVRERAAWAIARIGTAAASATTALRQAAASGPPRLKRLATQALESVRGMAA